MESNLSDPVQCDREGDTIQAVRSQRRGNEGTVVVVVERTAHVENLRLHFDSDIDLAERGLQPVRTKIGEVRALGVSIENFLRLRGTGSMVVGVDKDRPHIQDLHSYTSSACTSFETRKVVESVLVLGRAVENNGLRAEWLRARWRTDR